MIQALVFGGAFNPPTIAHIELVNEVRKAIGVNTVVFMPSKQSYIKEDQKKDFAFSDQERLELLNAIASSRPWMMVSDFEINSDHQPRSYETLCYLKTIGIQGKQLFGSDKLGELEHGWKYVDEMCKEFGIVVMARSNDDPRSIIEQSAYLTSLSPYIQVVNLSDDYKSISSTNVRKLLENRNENKEELAKLLLPEVMSILMR